MPGLRRAAGPALVAVAVLLLHGLIAIRSPSPGSFQKYNLAAAQWLAGELPTERLLDYSPLYFYLSVAGERLLPNPILALTVFQGILVALAVAFAFAIYCRRFSTGLAILAAVILAQDRHLLVYERILEPEACLLFFLCGFLWAIGEKRDGNVPSGAMALLAGVFAALCLATRPTFLPVFALVPLYLAWQGRPRAWRRPVVAFVVPVLLVFFGLSLRTAAISGSPRTPVMNPGTVFFEGNNLLARGTMALYPPTVLALMGGGGSDPGHEAYRRVARAAEGRDLTIAEVNAYWSGLAWRSIRAEPGRYLRLQLNKLGLALHNYRWHDISIAWRIDRSLPPTFPFAVVAALALLGMAFEAHRFQGVFLLYLVTGAQLAVMIVFYVSARHRVVLLPWLIYFAAVAVEHIWTEYRAKNRRVLLAAALAVLIAVALAIPDDAMRDEDYQRDGHTVLSALLPELRTRTQREPLAWHADLAVEAMASAPFWLDYMRPAGLPQDDHPLNEKILRRLNEKRSSKAVALDSLDFDRAVLLLEAGHFQEAVTLFEELGDLELSRSTAHPSLPRILAARAAALDGRREEAVEWLREALERHPRHPYALAELAAITGEPAWRTATQEALGELDARFLLGRAFLVHGRNAEAAAAFGHVTERLPELRPAQLGYIASLAALGRLEEAAARYLEVAGRFPQPLLYSRQIKVLFRSWAALHAGDPQKQLQAARILAHHGDFQTALELLRTISVTQPQAQAEIFRLERALSPLPLGESLR